MATRTYKTEWSKKDKLKIQKMRRAGKTPEEIAESISREDAFLAPPNQTASICTYCQEAVPNEQHGCCWSKEFKLVDGCNSEPSTSLIRSVRIRDCPLLNPDLIARYKKSRPKELSWIIFLTALVGEA